MIPGYDAWRTSAIRAHLLEGAVPSAAPAADVDEDAELRGMTPGQRLVRALEEALAWIRAEGLEDAGLDCAGRGESVPWLAAAAECIEEHLLKFDELLAGPQDMEHYVFQGLRDARERACGQEASGDVPRSAGPEDADEDVGAPRVPGLAGVSRGAVGNGGVG